MLYLLIFLTFFTFFSVPILGNCAPNSCAEKTKSCSISGFSESISQEIQSLHQDSAKKIEEVLNDKDFQYFLTQIKSQKSGDSTQALGLSSRSSSFLHPVSRSQNSDIYIFVSFSLGEKALLNLAEDAKRFGATLVLRGFKEGSYVKTAQALQKIILKTGQGVSIDPELFSLFDIQAVPTFILAKPFPIQATDRIQTPLHDRLQGHVSLNYALERFAQKGTLQNEAKALLMQGERK